jgi:hypothetical protein
MKYVRKRGDTVVVNPVLASLRMMPPGSPFLVGKDWRQKGSAIL